MHKYLFWITLVITISSCFSKGPERVDVIVPATSEAKPHEVHYIANEGVLIKTPDGNILIDALHDLYDQQYMPTPDGILDDLNAGNFPFENIDVVLITHVHQDHFDAKLVGEFLQQNKMPFVAAKQVCDSLRFHWPNAPFLNQLKELDMEQRITEFVIKNMKIKTMRLEHTAASFNGWIHNMGYHIEAGGRTYLHLGDAEITPDNLDKIEEAAGNSVDMAILPFWFLYTNGQNWMKARFHPGAIIGVHVKVPDSEQFEANMEAEFPNLEIFNVAMEKVVIN